MLERISHRIAVLLCVVLSFSCGGSDDLPVLAGNTQAASAKGEILYKEAKAADLAGKQAKAVKQYQKMADQYPFAPSAAQARFRQAELTEQNGDIPRAFEAYQKFLTRHQSSPLYSKALERQSKMAIGAAQGDIQSSFLGLKSKLPSEKIAEMLSSVRDNAPRSAVSAKAQFTLGEMYQNEKKAKEAMQAYRKLVEDQPESSYSPEALFRIGVVLMEEADRGNRNQATLELAREAFNDYLIQYPNHSKNGEARRLLKGIGGREIGRTLSIAEFYDRTGQAESAKIYYREVLKRASHGPEHEKAKARLKQLGQ